MLGMGKGVHGASPRCRGEPGTCQVLELSGSCMHASQVNAGPVPGSRAQNQQSQELCPVEPLSEAMTPRVVLAPVQLPFCLFKPPWRRQEEVSWRAMPIGGFTRIEGGGMNGPWGGEGKVSTLVPTLSPVLSIDLAPPGGWGGNRITACPPLARPSS